MLPILHHVAPYSIVEIHRFNPMSFSYNCHDTYMYSGIINPNEKPMKNSLVFHELCIAFFIGWTCFIGSTL